METPRKEDRASISKTRSLPGRIPKSKAAWIAGKMGNVAIAAATVLGPSIPLTACGPRDRSSALSSSYEDYTAGLGPESFKKFIKVTVKNIGNGELVNPTESQSLFDIDIENTSNVPLHLGGISLEFNGISSEEEKINAGVNVSSEDGRIIDNTSRLTDYGLAGPSPFVFLSFSIYKQDNKSWIEEQVPPGSKRSFRIGMNTDKFIAKKCITDPGQPFAQLSVQPTTVSFLENRKGGGSDFMNVQIEGIKSDFKVNAQ